MINLVDKIMSEFKAYNSKIKLLFYSILTIGILLILNIEFITNGIPKEFVKYFPLYVLDLLLFFSLLVFIKNLFISNPILIINQNGVYDRRWKIGFIPWKEIKGLQKKEYSMYSRIPFHNPKMKCIELDLYNPKMFSKKLPRIIQTINKNKFDLKVTALNVSLNELHEACQYYSKKAIL